VLGSLGARASPPLPRVPTRSFFWSWSTFGEGADVVYFSIAVGWRPRLDDSTDVKVLSPVRRR
jgi:hypothetical protein